MTPVLIKSLNIKSEQTTDILSLVPLDAPPYNENWLQDLIHNHPNLVPAGEVEACFENIIPVVREFTVPSGSLDNFYVTPDGYPVLVEVKLWKNQESRRKVVAQILEYAKDFAGMPYETINKEIRQKRKDRVWGENPLYELASENSPNIDTEQVFVNRVTRNLKEGRFLLLILGDGIREDMAALAEHLIQHSLRYALGIIQVQLFKLPDGNVIALPSVIAKTQTIERHVTVVTTKDNNIQINPQMPVVLERTEKTSLSLDDFFEKAEKTDRATASWLKEFLQSISEIPIDIQTGKNADTLMLKSPTGVTLMYINPPTANFWGLAERFKKSPKGMEVCKGILERFATISSADIKVFPAGGMDLRLNDKAIQLHSFYGKEHDLIAALSTAVQEISALEELN